MSFITGGMPNFPTVNPVMQAASADMASENAGLFERIQRSRAYGPQQTRLVPQNVFSQVKASLGS
jgi:hypothetical protein